MENFVTKNDILNRLVNLQQITFEVTDACNLKCEYCGYGEFYSDYDKRENTNLPIEKAYAILDYLIELWQSEMNKSAKKNVYISFYGGEPLLNVNFIEKVIDYINQKQILNRFFSYSMTTNAMLLGKYMDFVAKHNFGLLISLDGDEESQSYRVDHAGKNSFEKVMQNIKLLQKTYPDYFDKMVNFNAVLHNRSTYEKTYRFIKNEFGKMPNITELNNMGIRDDMKEAFMATYRNTYESLMQSEHYDEIEKDLFLKSGSYRTVTTFLHQYSPFVFRDYNELLYGKPEEYKIPTGTCLPFGKRMFVTVSGKILPCERIGHQFAMGQITDDNVVQLDLEQIAEKHNAYLNKVCNQCKTCKIARACIQCIYNLENLDGKPVCKGYTNQEEFEQYVASQMAFLEQHPEDYYRIMEEVIVE
ncbi:MAG: radical SAM peptide maturase [Bacteroidales bacterium]|jgi:uncharacterized protein|nr:radical SAM peptide maturase [Bacteroidales bacterium]